MRRSLGLFWFLAPAAYGQLQLSIVNGITQQPAPAVYDLGALYSNESASAKFRLRNTANVLTLVNVLAVDGSGFTISGVPVLPAPLDPQATLDFIVTFGAVNAGTYSATLRAEGTSVLLTATVLPRLTYRVDSQPLSALPVNFGSVERGSSVVRHFSIDNLTPLILTVPAIAVQGAFRLSAGSPSGIALQSRQTVAFDVQFAPTSAGAHVGTLVIGDRSYTLAGAAFEPLPAASVTVVLAQLQSAQQGTVEVKLDSAARTAGNGTLTLEFRSLSPAATDPAIVFSSGSQSMAFSILPGDTQPVTAAFQTGTTAGTLVFTVSLGGVTTQQRLAIPAAAAGLASVQGVRGSGSVELRVAGFDNTRTAGIVSYTFFDASGAAITPGAIRVDSSADFGRFFETSDAGGNFLLRSVFPVTGDVSAIAAFEVELTNSAGTAKTGRIAM